MSTAREHLAWLMWCWPEGYRKPEDRAILTNWLLEPVSTLAMSDVELRADLLQAADEVLAALLPDGLLMTDAQVGELAELRRWKAEAMQVLGDWETVWDELGQPGKLGQSKPDAALHAVRDLRTQIHRLGDEIDRW